MEGTRPELARWGIEKEGYRMNLDNHTARIPNRRKNYNRQVLQKVVTEIWTWFNTTLLIYIKLKIQK